MEPNQKQKLHTDYLSWNCPRPRSVSHHIHVSPAWPWHVQVGWADQSHIWCPTSDCLSPEECTWHHGELITQQQASGCCEDKGLASACFRCSLNQKTLKRKGSHMKGRDTLRKPRVGALPLIKEVESLQEKTPVDGTPPYALLLYLSLADFLLCL